MPTDADQAPPTAGSEELASSPAGDENQLARHSISMAQWTMVSRVSGFARAAVIAAVLGPTYLGNTFQATNYVPNIVFEFLTGSLLVTLLVPALVRHIDARRPREVERVAGGFLGVALAGFFAVTVLGIAGGPLLVKLLALQATGAGVADAQEHTGLILLALLMPQVMLYGIAGVGAAVMNAHGRYALAAAAPVFENVGVIATMTAAAVIYGTGEDVGTVSTGELILLGAGTTAAVALHAVAQWWGASRAGVRVIPRAGWRDPEVRQLLRLTLGSLGYAGLNGLRQLGVTIVANAVPGGVVAFSLALNFYWLPVKVGARSVYLAQLPRLARLHQALELRGFRDELIRGANRALFLTVPAAGAYLMLASPLAQAVAFGQFADPHGEHLLALALAGLALGLIGETGFLVSTQAAYARQDARAPFAAMILRVTVSGAGMLVTVIAVDGDAVVLGLGVAIAVGDIASAIYLAGRVSRGLPAGDVRLVPALVRAGGASLLMLVPAYLVAITVSQAGSGSADQLAIVLAGAAGIVSYVLVQRSWRSPELAFFASALPLGRLRR